MSDSTRPSSPCAISVVIPCLDEAPRVAAAIRSVRSFAGEVIVVDGGSRDGTPAVATQEGALVLTGPPGRGRQLDQGARAATGEWIVFLHADTRLGEGWAEGLVRLPPDVVGGAFRFAIDGARRSYRLVEAVVALRVRLFALPYGDQALFVRRSVYERMGGMPHLPLMEDVAFVRRLRAQGRLAFLPVRAVTSARRWERHGVFGATLRNWTLITLYTAGQPPERLARLYRRRRP